MCINTYTYHHMCMYASYVESSLWAGATLYKAPCTQKMSSKTLKKDWRAQHRGRWDLTQTHPIGGDNVTVEDTRQPNGPRCWKDTWPQSLTHPLLTSSQSYHCSIPSSFPLLHSGRSARVLEVRKPTYCLSSPWTCCVTLGMTFTLSA